MASIAHLSDVHFGRHDDAIVAAVESFLFDRRPDLVVISGDFTQRARVAQYRLACEFLDRLEQGGLAVIGVPGNHDVPLYDVMRRFARPLDRYKRFIDEDLCPWWENDEVAVLGINTARSFTIKDGSVSRDQMKRIRDSFAQVSAEKLRVLVTHHPLYAMPIGEEGALTKVAKRSSDALIAAAAAGVDLLLAGHFHRSFSQSALELSRGTVPHEPRPSELVENVGPALAIQAGTATSTRLRGDEQQSFNWIEASKQEIVLQIQAWEDDAFRGGPPARWSYDGAHWHREAQLA